MLLLLSLVLAAPPERTEVIAALRHCELVVKGKITNIETPPAKEFGDPAPQWKRATVKISSVLRGQASGATVKFAFISNKKPGYEIYRQVKLGQEGIWILTRGTGFVRELTMMTSADDHPVSAEAFLKELNAETACPEKPAGRCEHQGAVCPGAEFTCTCAPPCQGGVELPREYMEQLSWFCQPTACSAAKRGEKCGPDGLACGGCWGAELTCEKGRWKFHELSPPP